jgi:hypothetical protein
VQALTVNINKCRQLEKAACNRAETYIFAASNSFAKSPDKSGSEGGHFKILNK